MPDLHTHLPLNALRAFEAAVRHGSFQRAAKELFVTPGAVSHQVKLLETQLGFALFHRHAQGISATDGGRRYAQTVRALFDNLAQATRKLQMESRSEQVVTISATPSYITRWLMPRLTEFQSANRHVEVRLEAQVSTTDLLREDVDVCIRLGTGPYPGALVDDLQDEHFCALASPAYLEAHPIRQASDLLGATLLHDTYEPLVPDQIGWHQWLASAGVETGGNLPGHWFSHTYLTIEAALAGQGVVVASAPMIASALERGLLKTVLNGFSVSGPYKYRLLRMPEVAQRPAVSAFCRWILEQNAAAPPAPVPAMPRAVPG